MVAVLFTFQQYVGLLVTYLIIIIEPGIGNPLTVIFKKTVPAQP